MADDGCMIESIRSRFGNIKDIKTVYLLGIPRFKIKAHELESS